MKLVVVEWEDAWGGSQWITPEELEAVPSVNVTNVGWEYKRNKKGIWLVGCTSEVLYNSTFFIPARMVRKIKYIKGYDKK